jgi:hypothetical protein
MSSAPDSDASLLPAGRPGGRAGGLVERLRDHFTEAEWPRVAPLLARLQRNRWINERFEELRADGRSVDSACRQIAEDLPHDFSANSVEAVVYGRR